MINKLYRITCLLLFTCFSSSARSSETYLLSHIDHPEVASKYKTLVQQAYLNIGIEPKFVTVGTQEGWNLLGAGLVDGDVVRIESSIEKHKSTNVIKVMPALATSVVTLFCRTGLPCDGTVIKDANRSIVTTISNIETLTASLKVDKIQAEIVTIDKQDKIENMLKRKRFDYAILPQSTEAVDIFESFNFNKFELASESAYHVVTEKHAALVPKLSNALTYLLAKQDLVMSNAK